MAQKTNIAWTDQTRENNHNWKGGRTVASNGYVLVKVGTDHHLADVRGYAYEHRLVAENKMGRRLGEGEIVHHINGDKQDNRPENVAVMNGNAEHFVHHRKHTGRRLPGESNSEISCACGCGATLSQFDASGRPRRYLPGHNGHDSPVADVILESLKQHGTLLMRELVGNVGADKSTVHKHISRLIGDGLVKKTGHGVYAIVREVTA